MVVNIDIFLDGADAIIENCNNPLITGFTTNPSLMVKAGIRDYEAFAQKILSVVKDKPVSFEVLSDEFAVMYHQALTIQSWGKNVNVKIPITNTKGELSTPLIAELIGKNVNVNITAITLIGQVVQVIPVMQRAKHGFISVFAGRIADTGVDPVPVMNKIKYLMQECPDIKIIWASTREILNVIQAESCGCDIITIGFDLIKKYTLLGKDLKETSLDTVKMFYNDGKSFRIGLI